MRILVKYPSRQRPAQFLRVLKQWVSMAEDLTRLHFLFSFDKDDESMFDAGKEIEKLGIEATIIFRLSTSKVHAINRDIEDVTAPWDIVLVVSDDMVPVVNGWDAEIIRQMEANYPDTDGSLWFFDGSQRDICTLPCVGRKYYERTHYIYNPIYRSVFPDDEETHKAKALGKLAYIAQPIAHHRHPANYNEVKPDHLYRKNEHSAIYSADHKTYKARLAAGFP